jgi:putative oxidoreductase
MSSKDGSPDVFEAIERRTRRDRAAQVILSICWVRFVHPRSRRVAMNASLDKFLVPAGRVLLALIFMVSGFAKLTDLSGTAGYIASAGLPLASSLALGAGLLELGGGLALALGWRVRWAALALGVFTLAAGVLFHAYWSAPADQAYLQQLMFMKNLAIAGGLFLAAAFGAGSLSLDERLARDARPARA